MFWEKNYEIAFSLFNDAKILFPDEENIKICEENKAHCKYNYAINSINNCLNESDYNNITEILQSAEKMFNKKIL